MLVFVVVVPLDLETTLTVVLPELMVALAVEDELMLLDSAVVVAEGLCCPGLTMMSASTPATRSTTMRIEVATQTLETAGVNYAPPDITATELMASRAAAMLAKSTI